MSISTTVKGIQDIMRQDAGVDGDAQRISQLVWMLFLKIFEDREQELELLDTTYASPVPERLRWRNWLDLTCTHSRGGSKPIAPRPATMSTPPSAPLPVRTVW